MRAVSRNYVETVSLAVLYRYIDFYPLRLLLMCSLLWLKSFSHFDNKNIVDNNRIREKRVIIHDFESVKKRILHNKQKLKHGMYTELENV